MDFVMLIVVPLGAIASVVAAVWWATAGFLHDRSGERWGEAAESATSGTPAGATQAAARVLANDQPVEHRITVVVQLLFTHLRLDGILVDTVVLDALGGADGAVAIGGPLSLRLDRPSSDALGACSEALLELWAERNEVLTLDLAVQGDRVRAQLSNGGSHVVLDITEAAGLR